MKRASYLACAALFLGACAQQPSNPQAYYPSQPVQYPNAPGYYAQGGYYPPQQQYDPQAGFRRPHMFRNAVIGAAIGAGAGQLIGKDSEATATGAAIGGLIGAQINQP